MFYERIWVNVKMSPNDKISKKPHFNIIDLLIVIMVVAIAAAVIVRYDIADKIGKASSEDHVRITLLIRSIREEACNAVSEGDSFIWNQSENLVGEIIRKEVTPAVVYSERNDGAIVKNYSELAYDLKCTVDASGSMTEKGFMLGGTNYLAPGITITVHNESVVLSALVMAVESVN